MGLAYASDISAGQLIGTVPYVVVSVRVLVRQKVTYRPNKELVARIRQVANMDS